MQTEGAPKHDTLILAPRHIPEDSSFHRCILEEYYLPGGTVGWDSALQA